MIAITVRGDHPDSQFGRQRHHERTPRKGNKDTKDAKAIQPTSLAEIPELFLNIFGMRANAAGRMGIFKLEALSEDNEVHVIYDRAAAGGRHCDDCHIGFNLRGVR